MALDIYGQRKARNVARHHQNVNGKRGHTTAAMDKQMNTMCKSLKALGMEMDIEKLPDLGPCDIISELEETNKDENNKKNQ